jgi:hypothetical protein
MHPQDREWVPVIGVDDAVDLCIKLVLGHNLDNPVERYFFLFQPEFSNAQINQPLIKSYFFPSRRRNNGGSFWMLRA